MVLDEKYWRRPANNNAYNYCGLCTWYGHNNIFIMYLFMCIIKFFFRVQPLHIFINSTKVIMMIRLYYFFYAINSTDLFSHIVLNKKLQLEITEALRFVETNIYLQC